MKGCMRQKIAAMRIRGGGSIVNMSSVTSDITTVQANGQGGVNAVAKVAAIEVAKDNINVNSFEYERLRDQPGLSFTGEPRVVHRDANGELWLARSISSVANRGHVAPQHGGRPEQGLAQRHHRQLQRDATGLVHTVLHRRSHLGQMGVARRQVRGGIRDRDGRTAGEGIAGQPATHPCPMDMGVAIIAGIPLGTPQPASGGQVVR
jgi:NAD(P)-dependent dehydrogenase (short-subunit alcohol dehydrogenase family)